MPSCINMILNDNRLIFIERHRSEAYGEWIEAMSILSFFRRTKSKYADDKTVDDFTRVVEQTGILKNGNAARVEAGVQQGTAGEPGTETSIQDI